MSETPRTLADIFVLVRGADGRVVEVDTSERDAAAARAAASRQGSTTPTVWLGNSWGA